MQAGDFVYVGMVDGALQLTSGSSVKQISISDISEDVTWEDDVPYLMTSLGKLTAQLPMLEGIVSAVMAIRTKQIIQNNFNGSISSVLGFEGHYFTHLILGQLADIQLGLADVFGISPFDEIATIRSEQDRTTFLMSMMQNVVPLTQHIETTSNYLPSFATGIDAELLDSIGLREHLNIKNNELSYRHALQPITTLLSHLYKIDGAVSRLTSLRKQLLAQEGGWSKFIPLGISAAASFINPFALVATAQQGLNLMNKGDAQLSLEKDTRDDVFAICVKEWDYLIQTLLPITAYRVAQEIYPIRLNVTGILLGANEKADDATKVKLVNAVSRRYANLATYKSFPCSSVKDTTRGRSIDFIFELQKHAEAIQFRHF